MTEDKNNSGGTGRLPGWQRLFAVSLLSLFLELFVIRWLATEVRIFAYFKNMALMSAFLGLSLGFLWCQSKRDVFKWTPLILLYLSGILVSALALGITHMSFVTQSKDVMMFGNFEDFAGIRILYVSAVLLGIYALAVLLFVGLGQETGRLFQGFKPLTAYSINVAGGLAGILLFSYVSFLCTSPGVWLIIAGLLFMYLGRKVIPACIIIFGIVYMVYLGPFVAREAYKPDYVSTVWSPYYRIDVRESRIPNEGPFKGMSIGKDIFINYDSFQTMVDDRPSSLARFSKPLAEEIDEFHARPFICYGKPAKNVLIMGAGSGSDVAAALRAKAEHVDAIEIDQSIYQIGKELHPEKPYDSPKVSVHIMDARTFLRNTKTKYDIIVFAFLDSHTAFSSLSSLRTDNYIFTKESIMEATKLLSPDGILCVSFINKPDWLWDKHCAIAQAATGEMPLGFFKNNFLPSAFLISGPGVKGKTNKDFHLTFSPRQASASPDIAVSEDDWPFLFLPRRELPMTYVWPIFVIIFVGFLPLYKELKRGQDWTMDSLMFCLGMGFMLLEVRSMSELSLLFGSTWLVNGVIIAAVMLFILLSNFIASRLDNKWTPALTIILLVLLGLSTLVKASTLAGFGEVMGSILGCLVFLVPLIFSSAIFSLTFKNSLNMSRALSFNLVGGLVGVALEYLSMVYGIRALTYIAIGIYLVILFLTTKLVRAK